MAWNINFDGKTKLKDWWGVVRDNFIYLKNFITQVNDSIDTKIAEAQGINAQKHIADSADDTSEWIITDRYLVPVPAADGKVVYSEYAYVDGAWVVVGSTQEADLSGYYDKVKIDELMLGKTEVVCGVYSDLDYSIVNNKTHKAFVNLGFTPEAVEVYTSRGEQYGKDCSSGSGEYYGGLALKNHSCSADGRTLINIVENGFCVFRHSTTNDVTYDTIGSVTNSTRYFKAYKHCDVVTITGSGSDSGADNVITKEEA